MACMFGALSSPFFSVKEKAGSKYRTMRGNESASKELEEKIYGYSNNGLWNADMLNLGNSQDKFEPDSNGCAISKCYPEK
jgi:hypothetical protein